MKIEILAILFISLFVKSDSTYVWKRDEKKLEDSNATCVALGMRLLVMETKSDVDNLRDFLNYEKVELWLGLNWNSAVGNYEWSTGEQIPVANWCDEPDYRSSNQACVTWDKKCMKSITCSSTRQYFCFNTNNAPGYIIVSNSVDYFTAKKACDDNGGHLPMIRTMKEKEDLINFANLHGVNRVWLGGEEVAEDYIKWLSGEEFPVHIWHDNKEWEDFEKYPEVHVHVERDSLKFHADRDRTVEFVCETVEEPRNAGYFVHVADNMQTWALPLAELTVTKKMRCAMECSKSLRCRKYTIKLSVCTLYKDVLFHSSGSGNGESLWIKVF